MCYKICTFRNEKCLNNAWEREEIESNVEKWETYLTNRRKAMDNLVESYGYKSCHPIDDVDATKCAEDCEKFEKDKFAKNCTDNGGLFKCCIRRDKFKFCHECRFCCTLPMCTYPPGNKANTDFDMKHQTKMSNKISAKEIFFSDHHKNYNDNNYCIKPESHEDPKQWLRYELKGFRQAYTKEMLENTKKFKYDKYFSNFEDPEVFKLYTKNEKTAIKKFKKVYKNHFVSRVPGYLSSSSYQRGGNYTRPKLRVNYTTCIKKCIEMEKSQFAKNCEKARGYFKCCITGIGLMEYELKRNLLIKNDFIKDKPTDICKPKSMRDPCMICRTNGICTTRDRLTGEIIHSYYPKKKTNTEGKYR